MERRTLRRLLLTANLPIDAAAGETLQPIKLELVGRVSAPRRQWSGASFFSKRFARCKHLHDFPKQLGVERWVSLDAGVSSLPRLPYRIKKFLDFPRIQPGALDCHLANGSAG